MKIKKTRLIAAAPEKIWPLLTDPAQLIKWVPVEKIERTGSLSGGLNTTFYFEERTAGRLLKLHFKVSEWVENHRLAFQMTSGSGVKGYSQWYTLERTAEGCRFTVVEDVIMPYRFLGRVFGLVRRPVSLGRLQTMLEQLKVLAEAA